MEGSDDTKPCGVGIRGVSMGIDSSVWFALFLVAATIVGATTGQVETGADGIHTELEGMPATVAAVLWLGLAIGYHTLLEWRFGKTLGKYLVSIEVTDDDGSPPTLGASLVRNVVRLIDWLPVFYVVGIAALVASDRYRRLGDRVGHTVVVRQ